ATGGIRMSCEPFITTINTHHIYHKRQWFQASDSVYSGRISSIPDGYHLFRTDSVHSERLQDIRGVPGESLAFDMYLYSSAVFPVLDRRRHQFSSFRIDQTPGSLSWFCPRLITKRASNPPTRCRK